MTQPTVPLLPGLAMLLRKNFSGDKYFGDRAVMAYCIVNDAYHIIKCGETCACGRGCGGGNCICDACGYHDTDIEEFRADMKDLI